MNAARRLYMDNAATSFPKPPAVLEAMSSYALEIGASAGRGAYAEAVASGNVLDRCRAAACRFINGHDPRQIIFTLNCSDALNLAIKGLIDRTPVQIGEKPHAICTATDHNSILRPLHALADDGWIDLSIVPIDPQTGLIDPADVRAAWRHATRMIAVTHVSNVTGAIQPIREIAAVAHERAVPLIVDAAQSIGHLPIDVQADGIDLLAAPGHKGLMGPLGTGFLYVRPGLEKRLRPLREGGTGSKSDEPRQPDLLPDRFEAGSHNTIGLAGLLAGINWLEVRGLASVFEHERSLVRTFIEGVMNIEGLTVYGPQGVKDRIGVFSVRVDGVGPVELAGQLEERFGILTRAGIHCAPLVHKTIGTTEFGGTTRFSFGPFISTQDVAYATHALAELAAERLRLAAVR
jgi:cysteine desulfurase / selenocysteine lyase